MRTVAISCLQACLFWASLYHFNPTLKVDKSLCTTVCHESLRRPLTPGPDSCPNITCFCCKLGKHLCAAAEHTPEQALELSTFGLSCVLDLHNHQDFVNFCLRGIIRSVTCQQHHGCFVQDYAVANVHCQSCMLKPCVCATVVTTGSCQQVVLVKEKKKKRKSTLLSVITGTSQPPSSPGAG